MLSKLINFVKAHQSDIILVIGVILISLLSFAMGYIAALAEEDCLSADWAYNLNIGNLQINQEKLAGFCTAKTCVIDSGLIAIKSHFDPNFAVLIKDSEITVRAPYQLSKLGIIASSVNLDEYDWESNVKIDLEFLKHNGILKIEDSEIKKIAEFSKKGENIFYCQGEWKQLGSNCRCSNDKEACFECEGALPLAVSMPEDLMPYDLAVQEPVLEPATESILRTENQPPASSSVPDEIGTAAGQEEKLAKNWPIYRYPAVILFLIALFTIILKYFVKNKKIPKET